MEQEVINHGYCTLFYSMVLSSTLPWHIQFYPTHLSPTLWFSPLSYPTYSTLPNPAWYPTQPHSKLLYITLLYPLLPTPLCLIQLYSSQPKHTRVSVLKIQPLTRYKSNIFSGVIGNLKGHISVDPHNNVLWGSTEICLCWSGGQHQGSGAALGPSSTRRYS